MMRAIFLTLLCLSFTVKLLAQSAQYDEWYLHTDDSLRLFVKEIGSGKDTVVVVHGGFGANHDYMLDAIAGLEKDYHFILYDQRGSLMSPAPDDKLNFERNVNDLYTLLEELKIKKAKLMCHSMGTLVGMEFASRHSDRIEKLVLTGCLPTKLDSIGELFGEHMSKSVEWLTERDEVKKYLALYSDRVDSLTDRERTEYWRIQFASVNIYRIDRWNLLKGGQAYYKQEAAVMAETVNWKYDYRPVLNSLNATLIMGDKDFIDLELKIHREQLKAFQEIDLVEIQNAGHNSWVDEPEIFKKVLQSALN